MRAFPIVHIVDPRDRRDVLLSVTLIDPAHVEAFVGEVAHELAALLGVNREAAAPMVEIDQRGSVACQVPSEFVLAPSARRQMAVEVARALRFALGAQAVAA